MIRINLLPYRAKRRRAQILKHLLVFFGVLLGAIVIAGALHAYATATLRGLEDKYADLRQKNQMLQRKIGEIRNLDKLRAEVEQKLKLIDALQQGRFESFRTLLAIAEAIPQNVWITKLVDRGAQIQVYGVGESPAAVANFMRALDARPEFADVRLGVIARTEIGGAVLRKFDLTFRREQPGAAGRR
ncbi:MAG: fimbrial assembly protein [Zetaproteobacteria bacterium]|nr:MAG: fimbrial assembly protein [Zetaproteobacteria bacterium]